MVDVKLFQALLAAARYHCRIIMVGDADQLPSVGPGNILGEILKAGVVPTVRLTDIFRQAQRSLIVQNAHRIVEGQMPQKGGPKDDFLPDRVQRPCLPEAGLRPCQHAAAESLRL